MSISSRLASVGVKVLNVTLNAMVSMGIGLALNFILEGISNLANASKEAAESAKELNEAISNLDSYKQKIAELNEELASGNLSQAEAYEKRKELLAIQDELISKYGSEKDAIKKK